MSVSTGPCKLTHYPLQILTLNPDLMMSTNIFMKDMAFALPFKSYLM